MKGRKLSLEEVLQLEDGCKVWVEELRESWKDDSQIFVLNKDEEKMYDKEEIVLDYTNLTKLNS